jgi:hypothetical protein
MASHAHIARNDVGISKFTFFTTESVRKLFVSKFLHQYFSNKCAASFRQSGNICRAYWARFAFVRQFLPSVGALGKFSPERIFRARAKSMFKRF